MEENVEDTIIEIINIKKKEKEKEKEENESLNINDSNEILDDRIKILLKNKRIKDFTLDKDKEIKTKSNINKFINKNSFVNCEDESEEE